MQPMSLGLASLLVGGRDGWWCVCEWIGQLAIHQWLHSFSKTDRQTYGIQLVG